MTHADLSTRQIRILLILAEAPNHGYAISQRIEDETEGQIVLRPGSLYRALHQLLERGLIVERNDPTGDPRRRLYKLTPPGRRALSIELSRMAELVVRARRLGALEKKAYGK